MTVQLFRTLVASAMIGVIIPGASPILAQDAIHVGPNVQVSVDLPKMPHFEMLMAADPNNADHLMACSMAWPNNHYGSEVITYASFDRGKSWTPTLRTRGDQGRDSWDPTCAYGPGGVAYSVSENIDSTDKSYERLDRSTDGGRTWAAPVRMKHGERSFMTIDNSGGPRNGWIYLQGAGRVCATGIKCLTPSANYLRYSADGGKTMFGQMVPSAENNYLIGFGPGVVLSDGTFLAPLGEWKDFFREGESGPHENRLEFDRRYANTTLKVMRVTAARSNWPLEVDIATVGDWYLTRGWNESMMAYMAADATDGPFHDRVYMTYPDVGDGRARIMFTYSTDKGKTWSPPRVIDEERANADGSPGPDNIHGIVAVNNKGVVGVAWYDRRDHPDNLGWTVRFRASLDGGQTFLPSVKVSEIPYDPTRTDPIPLMDYGHSWGRINTPSRIGIHSFHYSGGHTAGFVADAGGAFHPLWVGNSTGVPQLWTASITVDGTAAKNGGGDLTNMVDVSGKVLMHYINRWYDRKTKTFSADLYLENVSKDTIRGPIKVRVLDMGSTVGVPKITNADADGTGEGAVWDFTRLVPGGVLLPHDTTASRPIRIVIGDVRTPFRAEGKVAVFDLAEFNTVILASSVTGPTKDKPGDVRKPGPGIMGEEHEDY